MGDARVVIDSNVWISALVFGGAPRRVYEVVVDGGVRIVVSAEILTEIRRVVSAKFPDFAEDVQALLAVLHDQVEMVTLGAVTITASRDPDDNRVLETAILGDAGTIISGDRDLLELDNFEGVAIVRASEWVEQHS